MEGGSLSAGVAAPDVVSSRRVCDFSDFKDSRRQQRNAFVAAAQRITDQQHRSRADGKHPANNLEGERFTVRVAMDVMQSLRFSF